MIANDVRSFYPGQVRGRADSRPERGGAPSLPDHGGRERLGPAGHHAKFTLLRRYKVAQAASMPWEEQLERRVPSSVYLAAFELGVLCILP